jgi:hypothetical protein
MEFSKTLKDWLGTFWQILISPTPKTFVAESDKAENKLGSAIGWAIFLAFYEYVVFALAGDPFDPAVLIVGLIALPLAVVLVPSSVHFILLRIFHRKQYLYDRVLYIFTAILVVFQVIATPLPFLVGLELSSIINYILYVYQFLLFGMAMKAIAKINYWQALITTVSSIMVAAVVFVCTFPFIISIIGGVNRTMR